MSIQNSCCTWNCLQEGCTYLDCEQWMLLLSTYYVHTLCKELSPILFPFNLIHRPTSPHLTGEDAEAQRAEVTCPGDWTQHWKPSLPSGALSTLNSHGCPKMGLTFSGVVRNL